MSAEWREPSKSRWRREPIRSVTVERRPKEDRIERDAICRMCHKEFVRPKGSTDSLCLKCLRGIS